jgi:hypothetical protein
VNAKASLRTWSALSECDLITIVIIIIIMHAASVVLRGENLVICGYRGTVCLDKDYQGGLAQLANRPSRGESSNCCMRYRRIGPVTWGCLVPLPGVETDSQEIPALWKYDESKTITSQRDSKWWLGAILSRLEVRFSIESADLTDRYSFATAAEAAIAEERG